jgi:aspartate aminotransferase
MNIAPYIAEILASPSSGVIRRMFEEGVELKKQFGPENVFDFSLGNPDLEPPPGVIATIERVARENTPGVHGYMPNAGFVAAREAMAHKTSQEHGVTVKADQVVMCAGAAAGLNCVLKAVVNPGSDGSGGDEVLVGAPYFPEYRHYAANHGGTLVVVEAGPKFDLNVAALASALTGKTAAVIVNSPNNPSGRVYSSASLAALAGALASHGKKTGRAPLLVLDEPYRDILYNNAVVPPVFPLYPDTVVVTSFAKNLSLPGERIGYVAANPAMPNVAAFINACVFANRSLGFVNASAFFQRVVAASWNTRADYSSYTERRNAIMSVMTSAGYEFAVPEGAFYLFARVPGEKARTTSADRDDLTFCNHLKNHHILCAPGSGFGAPGWFRIAYCVSAATITTSAGAFKKALDTW